jgi:hypothetical protein
MAKKRLIVPFLACMNALAGVRQKGVLAQDGVVAVGAGGDHMNGHAGNLLNALQV